MQSDGTTKLYRKSGFGLHQLRNCSNGLLSSAHRLAIGTPLTLRSWQCSSKRVPRLSDMCLDSTLFDDREGVRLGASIATHRSDSGKAQCSELQCMTPH